MTRLVVESTVVGTGVLSSSCAAMLSTAWTGALLMAKTTRWAMNAALSSGRKLICTRPGTTPDPPGIVKSLNSNVNVLIPSVSEKFRPSEISAPVGASNIRPGCRRSLVSIDARSSKGAAEWLIPASGHGEPRWWTRGNLPPLKSTLLVKPVLPTDPVAISSYPAPR
jgi:hypothetical protein